MGVRVRELLTMVPDGVLEKIGKDIGVDKANQKLSGAIVYKLLLYTLAKTTRISLRMMEFIYESALFQKMINLSNQKTRHSSLADRLGKINPDYFAEIFEYLVEAYNKRFSPKDAKKIYRFDSTLIGISAKLFPAGMNYSGLEGSPKNKHYVKVTIGQRGVIPSFVRFHTRQSEASEGSALRKAIQEASCSDEDWVIFDRGLSSGPAFIEFTQKNITFITRLRVGRKINVVETMEENTYESARKTDTLAILCDQKIQIWNIIKEKFFTMPFRLIRAKSLKSGEELWFLTNDFTLDAADITELYRQRWEIEVFFRFIKQELNFKHFLARNLNGLKSYLYMVLILSILLLIYKTSNNRPGYKIVRMYFAGELENEVIAEIVKCCGGDPQKFRDKYCPETNEVNYA